MPTFFTDSASFNNVQVTGSTLLSGSGVVLRVIGSGSTIFSISGSSGEIFSISDSGSSTNLFSVSSGSTTILQIDSSKNVSISGSLIITGSVIGLSYATSVGNGVNTSFNVTHGLGTRDVHVTVYSASGDFATVICDVFRSSSLDDIRLVFANPPATNEYRVVVSK